MHTTCVDMQFAFASLLFALSALTFAAATPTPQGSLPIFVCKPWNDLDLESVVLQKSYGATFFLIGAGPDVCISSYDM